jgi:hypothetical protein
MHKIASQSPKKLEKRPYRVNVRFSPEEYDHLRLQCSIANLRPAGFLRGLAAGTRIRPVSRLPDDVYRALKSLGGNLNQLAHQANIGRVDSKEVEALRSEVADLVLAIQG